MVHRITSVDPICWCDCTKAEDWEPLETALPIWWGGKFVPEGWDRLRRAVFCGDHDTESISEKELKRVAAIVQGTAIFFEPTPREMRRLARVALRFEASRLVVIDHQIVNGLWVESGG